MRTRYTRDPLIFSEEKDFSPDCLSHSGLTIYRCVPLRAFRVSEFQNVEISSKDNNSGLGSRYRCVPLRAFRVSEDTLGLTLLICRARARRRSRARTARTHVTHDTQRNTQTRNSELDFPVGDRFALTPPTSDTYIYIYIYM